LKLPLLGIVAGRLAGCASPPASRGNGSMAESAGQAAALPLNDL